MKFRKILQYVCYYIIPILLIIGSALDGSSDFYKELGAPAWLLLVLIMFSKPIAVIFKWKFVRRIVQVRRELGVACFWFTLFHGAGTYYTFGLNNTFLWGPWLYWAFVGGVGMILLGITSNQYSVKILKKGWKRLHYIAYLVLIAAAFHVALVWDTVLFAIIISAVFVALKIIEKIKSSSR